jgi:hypothetical protein
MPHHTDPVPRYTSGKTPITAARLNNMADKLTRTERDQRAWDNKYKPVGRQKPGKIPMCIQAVEFDYYQCKKWNGTDVEGNIINVAKELELRRAPFDPVNTTGDGATYVYTSPITRTRAFGGVTELQTIDPPFRLPSGTFKGSLVFVDKVNGETGVTVAGEKLKYVLIDARAWVTGCPES